MTREDRETRPLVMKAFRRLRKAGYVAKANFMCCGTCASSACFEEAEETKKAGVVWWHKQDDTSYRETGELWIGFGSVDDVSESTNSDAVGQDVVKALVDAGLKVEWNGSSKQRIRVTGRA